jgi:hypothetical protein
MDDVDVAQDRYMNEDQSTIFIDESEYDRYTVPRWLTIEKARQIYDEIKDYLKEELEVLDYESFNMSDQE